MINIYIFLKSFQKNLRYFPNILTIYPTYSSIYDRYIFNILTGFLRCSACCFILVFSSILPIFCWYSFRSIIGVEFRFKTTQYPIYRWNIANKIQFFNMVLTNTLVKSSSLHALLMAISPKKNKKTQNPTSKKWVTQSSKLPFKRALVNSVQRIVKGYDFEPTYLVGFKKKFIAVWQWALLNNDFHKWPFWKNK